MWHKKWFRWLIWSTVGLISLVVLGLIANEIYQEHLIRTQVVPTTIREVKQQAIMKNRKAWLQKYGTLTAKNSPGHSLDNLNGIVQAANPHSELLTSTQSSRILSDQQPTVDDDHGITWLTLPITTMDPNGHSGQQYIKTANQAIRKAKRGVVIDLTSNPGGDPATILLSVAPLLTDGQIFSGVTQTKQVKPYYLKNGRFTGGIAGTINSNYAKSAIGGKRLTLPVVILTGHDTASAAEMTTVALKNNPEVHTVGTPTYGATSVNTTIEHRYFQLTTELVLTVGWLQNNQGKVYRNQPIQPDYRATNQTQSDALIKRLIK